MPATSVQEKAPRNERDLAKRIQRSSAHARRPISYSRIALLGAIGYLLEWPLIIAFYNEPPTEQSELAAFYAANHADYISLMAGMTLALAALLAFGAGVRSVLQQAEGRSQLADLAFGCLVLAAGLELVDLGLGSLLALVVPAALNSAMPVGFVASSVARAVFVGVAAFAMLQTGILPRWIGLVGAASALMYGISSVVLAYGPRSSMDFVQFAGWLLMVVWMLTTGSVFFRRARAEATATS
jgi:hypothetical protein